MFVFIVGTTLLGMGKKVNSMFKKNSTMSTPLALRPQKSESYGGISKLNGASCMSLDELRRLLSSIQLISAPCERSISTHLKWSLSVGKIAFSFVEGTMVDFRTRVEKMDWRSTISLLSPSPHLDVSMLPRPDLTQNFRYSFLPRLFTCESR